MTLTLKQLYNDITGQPWSMFDGEIESSDEVESSVLTSIQKALSYLWCAYEYPFKIKTYNLKTKADKDNYSLPDGNIIKKVINNVECYSVKYNRNFLDYNADCEVKEEESGEPEYFYIKNDRLYLYPIPDNVYNIEIEYSSIFPVKDTNSNSKSTLENLTDYIDISEKYENLFRNALLPLAMSYGITSETDENYSGYRKQFEEAYKNLIDFSKNINFTRRVSW